MEIDEPLIDVDEDVRKAEEISGSQNVLESSEIIDGEELLQTSVEKDTKPDQNEDNFEKAFLIPTTKLSYEEVKNENEAEAEKGSKLSTSDEIEQMHLKEDFLMLNTLQTFEEDLGKGPSLDTLSEKDTFDEEMHKEATELNVEADENNNNNNAENELNISSLERDHCIENNETVVVANQEYSNSAEFNILSPTGTLETNENNNAQPTNSMEETSKILTENQVQTNDDITCGNTATKESNEILNESEVCEDEKSSNIFLKIICCCCCCSGRRWTLSKYLRQCCNVFATNYFREKKIMQN